MTATSLAPTATRSGSGTRGWQPQPGPQTAAILTGQFIDELFFGGAVGGGKTDFLIGDFAQDVGVGHGPEWKGILFRRTFGELEEIIARSQEIYPAWFRGATYTSSDKTWTFPDGATLKLRYLEHATDWMRYWGHQYSWIGWDELPSWADLVAYNKMKARLRSAAGIRCLRIRATGNPGGPGHQEVKRYFGIDRHPHGSVPIMDAVTGTSRMFIRSRVQDNQILMRNDPGYVQRLQGLGSAELVRAWLEGDWDVVLGAYFDCWSSARHVIRPIPLKRHWLKFRSFDWGSAAPFSVGWWTVPSEDVPHPDGFVVPKGALIRYREWYGAKQDESGATIPNEGLKLTVEEVAEGIKTREAKDPGATESGQKVHYSVADPSIFTTDGGPSFAERFMRAGVHFRPADNKRVSQIGHAGGWDQMRQRLIGDGDGRPMIYTFSTCLDSIRTIPALQHDESKPEDVDTDGEDHAGDEWRYACMSRPWMRPQPPEAQPIKGLEGLSLNRLWTEQQKRRKRR